MLNIHERIIAAPIDRVGGLIDGLSSRGDQLWPHELWPAMRFDRPLAVGARGGHGPIRYDVAAYEPGRSVRFRFTGPKGFNGFHELVAEPRGAGCTCLRHTLQMRTTGLARLSWPLLYRPLRRAGQRRVLPRLRARWRALVGACAAAAMAFVSGAQITRTWGQGYRPSPLGGEDVRP